MNGKLDFWKLLSAMLAALVMFLAGWVWNMERRVTTLEVSRPYMQETVDEIKTDMKEIKVLLLQHLRVEP